jgi:hydrogenase maturation factor
MSRFRLGKVPNDVLKSLVFGRLGVDDDSVILGPSVGEDAALIRLGKTFRRSAAKSESSPSM